MARKPTTFRKRWTRALQVVRPTDGGVGGDQAFDAAINCQIDDFRDIAIRQIRRDLEHDRGRRGLRTGVERKIRMRARASMVWWSRKPGVFGLETLITR